MKTPSETAAPRTSDSLRNPKMQTAVRAVLKHHKLLGDRPGDGVVEADLIYAVLDNLEPK